MSVLAVPDGGLHLGSSDASELLPMQAFGLALNDGVIEDMIRCVQNGQKIELFLGSNPSLQYGDEEEPLKPTSDSFDYDLYLTNLAESSTKAQRLPYPTMSILKKPPTVKGAKPNVRVEKVVKGGKSAKSKLLPQGKSAMAMALSSSGTTRSLPSSPALKGVGSPSHNPAIAAAQQLMEKNKEQRTTVVHELAVQDQNYDYLKDRWSGSEADLKNILGKVGDKKGDRWSLSKNYWKELDVWNYNYEPSQNRQLAIDNAKKQYDRQRLGTTDPAWERLLEEKDRGKGIILSKLQAALAKGNMTPAAKPAKADDASSKNSSDESVKAKAGGEAMARSSSQPVGAKPNRVGDREVQSKKLLSNKATTKKPTTTTKKAAPVSKAKAADKGTKKFLSEEYVHDTSSEDEAPLAATSTSKPKPAHSPVHKSAPKPMEKPVEKPKERSPAPIVKPRERSPAPAAKPKSKPTIRAPRPAGNIAARAASSTSQKRPREEEDSSSSSGAPLSKRTKPKETTTMTKPLSSNTALKHRPSDASQNSRGTPSNVSYKSKNTSPAKSSPLASSPPTNASDLEDNSQSQHHDGHRQSSAAPRTNGHTATVNGHTPNGVSSAVKRPPGSQIHTSSQPPTKKARVSHDVITKAHSFDLVYDQYKVLHEQLTRMADPPEEKLERLHKMRRRLVSLKTEIRQQVGLTA
ncbi:hypothetical protein JX265_011326 [Neoarthrinium moseri]|uniref:Uncharacterized protein n=1 Tax=Neoarthrinium moseri TaxID=1658444 RepID=A0A9Q0AHN8_9PEZI|nr:uncharacterized protein JN550_013633 [Neoarthrinium moseri]KAI1844789.1 hypothetical protein JX266_009017 [Neoarthrinium moseri]KAI1856859.1 hypothetical protein JN550_013633 [Neoarthrinium moseri]KAI1857125.1 hypothetical protein JX265_011326 [Neoarthrinium moseri]